MVLQGAAKVFAASGVRLASVEDILEAARISRRTFYRVYSSKEDVLLALYKIGTERLLDACRLALEQESDPLRQAERCIDAHLQTAREQPRLVFVLGGEAQRHESLLHSRQ
jgi:AcrR family transcriptional regulator